MFENRLKRIQKTQKNAINIFEGVMRGLQGANDDLEKVLKEIDDKKTLLTVQAKEASAMMNSNLKVMHNINNILGGDSVE